MNVRTLKALKGSIRKWEKIWKGTGEDLGGYNCPLCQLPGSCVGCPVYERTGWGSCGKTPFGGWIQHHWDKHWDEHPVIIYCPTCKRLAKRELDFLKSLLPKGKGKK